MASADVALLLDRNGVVRDAAIRDPRLAAELGNPDRWRGRRWRGTVTVESRPKLDALLSAAAAANDDAPPPRWRHLNHPAALPGPDVPIAYSAVPAGPDGSTVVLGRDLRASAALQQRLVDAQQALERDHHELRDAESRFHAVFETGRDALLLLDPRTLRATGANAVARTLFGLAPRRLPVRALPDLLDEPGRAALLDRADALAAGTAGRDTTDAPMDAALRGTALRMTLQALPGEEKPLLLARLWPAADAAAAATGEPALPPLVDAMPDGVALCDASGDLLAVNPAFRTLCGLPAARPLRGEPLSNWIGDEAVDLSVLLDNLRRHNAVRQFSTVLRPEPGGLLPVEIAGTAIDDHFALFLRDTSRRLPTGAAASAAPDPVPGAEQMKALIGRVSLKELVRESADAIERLCIESALDMTGNNRASAAAMLGLSRQSLYVKLHRYGMQNADDGEDATE